VFVDKVEYDVVTEAVEAEVGDNELEGEVKTWRGVVEETKVTGAGVGEGKLIGRRVVVVIFVFMCWWVMRFKIILNSASSVDSLYFSFTFSNIVNKYARKHFSKQLGWYLERQYRLTFSPTRRPCKRRYWTGKLHSDESWSSFKLSPIIFDVVLLTIAASIKYMLTSVVLLSIWLIIVFHSVKMHLALQWECPVKSVLHISKISGTKYFTPCNIPLNVLFVQLTCRGGSLWYMRNCVSSRNDAIHFCWQAGFLRLLLQKLRSLAIWLLAVDLK